VPGILFFVSLAFVAPYVFHGGILAAGESSLYINPSLYNYFSTWEDKLNFGYFSYHQSNIWLYSFFWSVLELFSFMIHPSVLFIFLSTFLSSLFLYICLDGILKLKQKYIYLPACLLYSYNVFRVLGPLNERLNLLFIFLPLFFLFYYKLLETGKWKYVFWLIIISLFSSSMAANLPVFSIPYLLLFLYLVFYLLKNYLFRKGEKNQRKLKLIFKQHAILILLFLGSHSFWIISLASYLSDLYNQNEGGTALWSATGAGTFYDHFRFLGSWAWRSGSGGNLYYPFSVNYDKLLLLVTTFFVSVFSFYYWVKLKKKSFLSLKVFFAVLTLLSLFLLAGSKKPLGAIFDLIYQNVSLFRMYREPFTKFTPLLIFSMSFGLTFSLYYFFEKLKTNKYKMGFVFLLSLIILLNAYPLFTTETMPIKKWDNGNRDFLIKVPSYWTEAKNQIDKNRLDSRLAVFPYNPYGLSYFWERGASFAGNMADYLFEARISRAWNIDKTNAGKILVDIFNEENKENGFNLNKYLGFLNSRNLLQENDVEWRYSGGKIASPSQVSAWLEAQGFTDAYEFGKFTPEYLAKIPNEEPKEELRGEFYQELSGRPALALYNSTRDYFLPHFYTSENNIVSGRTIADLPKIVSGENWQTRSAVIFKEQNTEKENLVNRIAQGNLGGDQVLEFKKINSTKYRIRVHGAAKEFILVFLESFNPDWNIYKNQNSKIKMSSYARSREARQSDNLKFRIQNYKKIENNESDQANKEELIELIKKGYVSNLGDKDEEIDFVSKNFQGTIQNDNLPDGNVWETWFQKSIDNNGNQLMANGYANSWVIDPGSLCDNNDCIKNSDGTYDFELIAEFRPQRFLYGELLASGIILLGSIGYLIWEARKNNE